MATSSTKKTAKPEGEAAPAKKPRAVKTAAPKDPAEKAPKKAPAKEKAAKAEVVTPTPPAPAPAPSAKKPAAAPTPTAAAPDVTPEEIIDESKVIQMKPPIQVRDLATRLNLKPFQLIHELMEMNVFATLNQNIEEAVAKKICEKRGFVFLAEKRKEGGGVHKVAPVVEPPKAKPVPSANLKPRPPIVTFMGHVDHGKTSLLDAIRRAKVAAGEAGGITQHIGAYTVQRNNHSITFLDTPGHEAFTAMRARGANVTDIVVLVVAADDGIKPQTLEALRHAQAAKVTIMVAINKVDLPNANLDKVKGQLQELGLAPEEWGGQTVVCEVSATKGTGIEKLLEMIALQSEVLELRADPTGNARARVIETQIETGRGPTATVLVQHGCLKVGDSFVCGPHQGKVKALLDDAGNAITTAGPSVPTRIIGLSGAPSPGEEVVVVSSEREARTIVEERQEAQRATRLAAGPGAPTGVTLENLFASIADGQKKCLRVVLKGDVQGSVEAIVEAIRKIQSQKVTLEIILSTIGPISESDILLAKASGAVVIGFNTKTDNSAANAAKREGIQIKLFSIIYELVDQVKEAMTGLLDPELRESPLGNALVKKVFELSKFMVAGSQVQSGRITKSGRARVIRKKQPIYDGAVVTLKRFQEDVPEVRQGLECGIRLGNFDEYEEGDIIECYQLEKVPQTL
ncbi:MAG: translation initiation factor IF-2 [Verrucomicrobia bacterium]|nr:translation initiation factor IF-2 [Verrucomicrobiota bacterium]